MTHTLMRLQTDSGQRAGSSYRTRSGEASAVRAAARAFLLRLLGLRSPPLAEAELAALGGGVRTEQQSVRGPGLPEPGGTGGPPPARLERQGPRRALLGATSSLARLLRLGASGRRSPCPRPGAQGRGRPAGPVRGGGTPRGTHGERARPARALQPARSGLKPESLRQTWCRQRRTERGVSASVRT